VGIAIGGVIAANALSGAHALPQLLSATQAAAEEALQPKPAKGGKHGKSAAAASGEAAAVGPDSAKAQSSMPSGAAALAPAPICAQSPTDLAKAAGLSPAELQVLQSLQNRRGQIDSREKDLDTEVQLLAAAEAKLDGKLKSMNTLKADIQALMGQADVKTQAEVDRLTVVYSKMKPQDAAAVMAQLDDKVRLPIASAMKPAVLSQILGKMGTLEAKELTEKLAHRFAPIQALVAAGMASPVTAPAPTAPPAKGVKAAKAAPPADAANAADAADDPTADAADAKPVKKPAPRPKHIAKAAPKKAPPPKAKTPLAQAKADDAAMPSKPQPYAAVKDKAPAAPSAPAAVAPAKSS
jgi:flagellar motility protein MotE (MotC chaperone)